MRTPSARTRRLLAGVLLVAVLAGCGSTPTHPAAAGGRGGGAGRATQSQRPGAGPNAALNGATSPHGGNPSGRPTTKAGTSPTPGKNPTEPSSENFAARLPKFGPAPAAQRVNLPEGTSAAWFTHIPTDQPVAFLTIDDGWIKRPEALALIKQAGIPVTLFLAINAIKDNPEYFKKLQAAGAVIEAHTITHAELKGKSYDFQHREICGSADQLGTIFGRRPVIFRPPFGDKDATTLRVVHDCGMKAAFFWKETVDKGIVRYQKGNTVQAGDIILMHFRERFADDFIAALQAIKNAGLTPALLEDYLPTA